MAISLGAEAMLQLRPTGSEEPTCELRVTPGSLYVLRGPARRDYQHQVVPVESERYSLTFRHVPGSAGA